ncbi:hypothetical protein HGO21_29330 [Acinetobacter sp. CUI P1]|nr:hypothetical protein [Acinetobacter sp. CUI P1]
MRNAYLRIIGKLPSVWSILQGRVVDEHWTAIEFALEFALSRVDCSRSEREIIRYINLATRTEYFRSQVDGLRRVRREGRKVYVSPRYLGATYAIFGNVSGRTDTLTPRLRQLVTRITAIIEEDMRNGRVGDYSVDLNGGYRIKNRHIASKLGIHEASLSRALGPIRSVKH